MSDHVHVGFRTLRQMIDAAEARQDLSNYDPDPPATEAQARTLAEVEYADSVGRLITPKGIAEETKKSLNSEAKILADLLALGWVEKFGAAYGITEEGRGKLREAKARARARGRKKR